MSGRTVRGAWLTRRAVAYGVAGALVILRPPTATSAVSGDAAPYPAPAPVLRPLQANAQGRAPSGPGLQRAVQPLTGTTPVAGHASVAVAEPFSGRLLFQQGAGRPSVPASTAKLFTAAAAMLTLGPDARLRTRVVAGADPHQLVLVGGGDPTLQVRRGGQTGPTAYPHRATLHRLAVATARRLGGSGIRTVRLRYNDSLFTGPAVDPAWRPNYVPSGAVAPVSALAVDEGRVAPGAFQREPDPARTASLAFAEQLGAAGIEVDGPPAEGRARRSTAQLAQVSSAPVSALVAGMLGRSDNDLAEAMARHVALATGREPSFAGAGRAVRAAVAGAGVDVRGVRLRDGSGLSRRDRIPVRALAQLLGLATSSRYPVLRTLLASLPVAGSTGTLAERFEGPAAAGRGTVRAKTGTLSGVRALAGTAVDRSGHLLVFALNVDGLSGRDDARDTRLQARLDRVAARLAACGCR